MTYLLSYSILANKEVETLEACVKMGAKVEDIKAFSSLAPWIVGRDYSCRFNCTSPLSCAMETKCVDVNTLKWLKNNMPTTFTDQAWLSYFKRYTA